MFTLQQAQQFIEQGDCNKARRILAYILRENRDNVDAWVLLSRCTFNQYEYDRCKKEVLRRVPNHSAFQTQHNITEQTESVEESLAALGLMTQQMPAITAKQVQAARRSAQQHESPAYLNAFRRRILRGVFFTGIAVVMLMALVLLGVYLNNVAEENARNATVTRTAYDAAVATVYAENTFTVATVAARATQVAATEQAYPTPVPSVIRLAWLVFLQPDGTEEPRTAFLSDEPISVIVELLPTLDSDALLMIQLVDENGRIVVEQAQPNDAARVITLQPPDTNWPVGFYTLKLLVNGVIEAELLLQIVQ